MKSFTEFPFIYLLKNGERQDYLIFSSCPELMEENKVLQSRLIELQTELDIKVSKFKNHNTYIMHLEEYIMLKYRINGTCWKFNTNRIVDIE